MPVSLLLPPSFRSPVTLSSPADESESTPPSPYQVERDREFEQDLARGDAKALCGWAHDGGLRPEQLSRLLDAALDLWIREPLPKQAWEPSGKKAAETILARTRPVPHQKERLLQGIGQGRGPFGVAVLALLGLPNLTPEELDTLWERALHEQLYDSLAECAALTPVRALELMGKRYGGNALREILALNPAVRHDPTVRLRLRQSSAWRIRFALLRFSADQAEARSLFQELLREAPAQALRLLESDGLCPAVLPGALRPKDLTPALSHPDAEVRLQAIRASAHLSQVAAVPLPAERIPSRS